MAMMGGVNRFRTYQAIDHECTSRCTGITHFELVYSEQVPTGRWATVIPHEIRVMYAYTYGIDLISVEHAKPEEKYNDEENVYEVLSVSKSGKWRSVWWVSWHPVEHPRRGRRLPPRAFSGGISGLGAIAGEARRRKMPEPVVIEAPIKVVRQPAPKPKPEPKPKRKPNMCERCNEHRKVIKTPYCKGCNKSLMESLQVKRVLARQKAQYNVRENERLNQEEIDRIEWEE